MSLHVQSGSKTTLIRRPIEVCASKGPSQTVENSVGNTEPGDVVLPSNTEVLENKCTRSNPPRIAVQIVRYRLKELALD